MAALTDLINQVEDKALRERLLQEAERLSKKRNSDLFLRSTFLNVPLSMALALSAAALLRKRPARSTMCIA